MGRKIKILGIAPYQNLRTVMLSVAEEYDNIEMTVYTGNLEDGVQIALQHMDEDFDILISRGGTAKMIREISRIPVVEITISINDILRSALMLENTGQRYATVGYPNITQPAKRLYEMMHYDAPIITIHQKDDLDHVLEKLKKDGYNLVLCDVISEIRTREAGMEPILIVSGPEGIASAIDSAINICEEIEEMTAHSRLFTEALKLHGKQTVILKEDSTVLFSAYNEENAASVIEYLQGLVKDASALAPKGFHMIDDTLYSILAKKVDCMGRTNYIFSLEQNPIPIGGSKHGLRFSSYTEMSVLYSSSFYSLTASARLIEEKIRMFGQNMQPVMIIGERGSGKNQVAAKLYLESSMSKHPFVSIECNAITDKLWNFIVNNYNSPFNDRNNTIFLGNLHALSVQRQVQLLSLLEDTNAYRRNRILFSVSLEPNSVIPDSIRNFIDRLTCITICMPPLRDLTEDIAASSVLYLNKLNVTLSRQIIGFTPEALALMTGYSWPDNFQQLKRVLTELAMLTYHSYIQAETVEQVLTKEKRQYVPAPLHEFNYDRTLNEMTQEIVKVVLAQCGGNQTAAAKKLGIGRTTLWRYLNSEG